MALPDWRSYSGGSMKRAALWLASEVGEGRTFTKERLRAAFPGVAQIDRRVRDLRDDGWVIHTNREDVSLGAEEQRLVVLGGRVWERGYRRSGARALTNKERQAVFARDDYCCTGCGVAGGEPYPDYPLRKSKLAVARGRLGPDGPERLVTVCDRCHSGDLALPDPAQLREALDALDDVQRGRLRRWVAAGRRSLAPEERVFATYRRLPGNERSDIAAYLTAPGRR